MKKLKIYDDGTVCSRTRVLNNSIWKLNFSPGNAASHGAQYGKERQKVEVKREKKKEESKGVGKYQMQSRELISHNLNSAKSAPVVAKTKPSAELVFIPVVQLQRRVWKAA